MFPQAQPEPRNELYEFPLEAMTTEQHLQRRANLVREILLNEVSNLIEVKREWDEDPKKHWQEALLQNGQPVIDAETKQRKTVQVTITQKLARHQERVKNWRRKYEILEEMLAAFDENVLDSALLSDEYLETPEDPAPIESTVEVEKK